MVRYYSIYIVSVRMDAQKKKFATLTVSIVFKLTEHDGSTATKTILFDMLDDGQLSSMCACARSQSPRVGKYNALSHLALFPIPILYHYHSHRVHALSLH